MIIKNIKIDDCCRDKENRTWEGEPYMTDHPNLEKNQLPVTAATNFRCAAYSCNKCNRVWYFLVNHEECNPNLCDDRCSAGCVDYRYARYKEDFILTIALNDCSRFAW